VRFRLYIAALSPPHSSSRKVSFQMTAHKLDLLENAIDSLDEALKKFSEGDSGQTKSYKFAVLHLAHFVELVLKHHIASKHPLLIYQRPFDKKLDIEKTIGLWEAVNFINNENAGSISNELRSDLEFLKKLRNQIEHHKFELDVADTRVLIGRLFSSFLLFLESHSQLDLEARISEGAMTTFKILSDEYEFKRNEAMRSADEIEARTNFDHKDPDEIPVRLHCQDCDLYAMVRSEKGKFGFICLFCGSEEQDEIPVSCTNCGARGELGLMDSAYDDEIGYEIRCNHCSGRYLMDKED
jgi:hypothetical protein